MLERPDEMAALITARLTGLKVRITGLTSESAEYIAHPNGQVEATVHAGPVRMRQNNSWVTLNLNLKAGADGSVSAVAHPLDLWISGARDGEGELAAVGEGDSRLALGWPGPLPTPVLSENRATYPEVAAGIDLVVEATRTGFSQYLTVKDRAAVDRLPSLALPLTGKGLGSFSQDSSGGLTLKDAKGQPVAVVPAPEMWDAQRAPGSQEPTRRATIRAKVERPTLPAGRDADGLVMRLQPDLGWLKDPATRFPVTIDPQINSLYTSFSTYVKERDTAGRSGANDLQFGLLAGSPSAKSRGFVHWPVSALAGKQITAATVYFWSFWSHACTQTSWEIWTTKAASSATRWDTQPEWVQKEATSTQTKGYSAACDDGWVSIDGKGFFQRAATAGQATAYMGVRGTDETNVNSFKQFRSRNAVSSSQVPYAVVTYNSYPTVGTRSTVPSTACVTGVDRPKVNTLTPQLKAVISDAEGSPVKAEFEWWTLAGTSKAGSTLTGTAASGSTLSATVPAGAFTHNNSYRWRVRGNDGTVDGAWSSFCEFIVDTSIGSAPVITSTTYPEDNWGGDANLAGDFTFDANGVDDAAAYEYSLDVQPVNKVVNTAYPGAPATVSIKPATPGWHTVWARTRDSAGNVTELRKYPFKVGKAALTSPKDGDVSGARTTLAATASPSFTAVTYQWRRGGSDGWVDIPAAHVSYAVGGGPITWPVPVTSGTAPKLSWDIAATLAAVDAQGIPRDGPVQVRAYYFNPTNNGAPSDRVKMTFDRNLASADTAQVGPGSVNLITGNYQIAAADVAMAGLGITRTVNSRQPLGLDPLFGPGWVSGLVVADANAPYTKLTTYGSLAQVKLPDDSTIGFTKVDNPGVNYEPQVGAESYKLTFNSATSTFTLIDGDGNFVTFTRTSTDPAGVYTPTAVTPPGSGNTTTYGWEKVTVGTQTLMRPTRMLAPVPGGVTCTTLDRGCRALTLTYATTTTATGLADGTWGDYLGRVSQISYTAWDPDLPTPAMRTVVLARYTYDSTGRLRTFSDPRLDYTENGTTKSLRTVYYYNGDGIIVSLTPPAQLPWQFYYTTLPDDPGKGRLHKVTRSALSAGTAVETVVYQVPTTGSHAPYDLSAGQTARWGQTEPPTDATAIFPATQVPNGDPAAGTLPGSYERASVTYLDSNARTVNTVQPGGQISTTWYGEYGNVVRELTAGNRQRVLDASATDDAAAEAELAARLSEASAYSEDGQRLLESFGPEHDVVLPTDTVVRGRIHTRYTYDEGAPNTGGPFNLLTTQRVSVSYVSAGQDVDADTRTTTTLYDWTLRQPSQVTVDPSGLDLVVRTTYDASGRTIATTTPAGGGVDTTPATRITVYYTAAANATYPECGNRAEWASSPCRTQTGGQPESGPELPDVITTYDMYGQPRVKSEKTSAGVLRRTEITYDVAGRSWEVSITASGLGEALEKRRDIYALESGQLIRTQSVNSSGTITDEIIRNFDALGRLITYTDADGNISASTYDIAGRQVTVNDGKGTRTYTYDGGNERRGLPTSIADSQTGTLTGSYDSDGAVISQTWPNGLVVNLTTDETSATTGITYTRPGCGQVDCTLYTETVASSAHGQWRSRVSTLSAQVYAYDEAARLTNVRDIVGGQCATRSYGFDTAANRTSLVQYSPGAGGVCQTSTATTTQDWTYDSADRTSNAGYTYDVLGRTLTQPAPDLPVAGGGGSTMTYHVNDMVHSIAQGTRAATYAIDVIANRIRLWADSADGLTKRNHYVDDNDNPAWTDEGNGNLSRSIAGLAGLAGTFTNTTGVIWAITNLHGDHIAGMVETDPGFAYTGEHTEYGQPRNLADVGARRYGYLGSYQRAADTPDGSILMGARIYSPTVGRFKSMDSVYRGSANSYDYANQDPLNQFDTDGTFSWSVRLVIKVVATALGASTGLCRPLALPWGIVCSIGLGGLAGLLMYFYHKNGWGTFQGGALAFVGGAGAGLMKTYGNLLGKFFFGTKLGYSLLNKLSRVKGMKKAAEGILNWATKY